MSVYSYHEHIRLEIRNKLNQSAVGLPEPSDAGVLVISVPTRSLLVPSHLPSLHDQAQGGTKGSGTGEP
ncbi:hypothetical protein E2C01_006274 [Portunus trituberculatus]|uniref:Uncharacterized protein n=1 Tax=Portunus trituberculatus TaxID=210409 RepID=A0A5B7CYV4_PORTR|nr:hypothetical protein [Portunus trituberculatus]